MKHKLFQNQKKSFHWCHQALHEALAKQVPSDFGINIMWNLTLVFWKTQETRKQAKCSWWNSNKSFCTAGRAAVIPNGENHQPSLDLVLMGNRSPTFQVIPSDIWDLLSYKHENGKQGQNFSVCFWNLDSCKMWVFLSVLIPCFL